jgi:acetyltransferase-like isoleucine patch superfamily enzyme
MWNFCVVYTCRYLPSVRWKNRLYRMIGAQVGEHVSAGLGATLDIFFPQLIQLGENTIIGYNSVILAHEFLIDELRTGPVKIGKNVMIGANVTILAGVEIGDGATISACSLVNSDVPPGAVFGGVPARRLDDEVPGGRHPVQAASGGAATMERDGVFAVTPEGTHSVETKVDGMPKQRGT